MEKAVRIQPDLQFIKDLQEVGGDTLKKCYQCATCSVACPLSPADNPYPRKEMVWAQWGMKDKLVNDIDIWLCHNCGTCSDLCPRGAKPGDLLAALRNMAYRNLVQPAAFGKWMSSSKYLPILIGIPAILWAIIWFIRAGQLGSFFPRFVPDGLNWAFDPNGSVIYGGLFPGNYTIDPIYGATVLFVAFSFYKGVMNMWNSFKDVPTVFNVGDHSERPSLIQCLVDTIKDEVLTHRKWVDCGYESEGDEQKYKGHLLLFYGFVACAIVTSIVAVTHWGGYIISFIAPVGHTPMPLWSPVKILANLGALALLYGLTQLTKRRLNQDETKHGSSFYDWYLLGVIWVVALTGILAELLRLADIAGLAYPVYYIHLVSVMMLFLYLPWSKLGHLVYRTTALVYARYIGRLPMPQKEDKTFIL